MFYIPYISHVQLHKDVVTNQGTKLFNLLVLLVMFLSGVFKVFFVEYVVNFGNTYTKPKHLIWCKIV